MLFFTHSSPKKLLTTKKLFKIDLFVYNKLFFMAATLACASADQIQYKAEPKYLLHRPLSGLVTPI